MTPGAVRLLVLAAAAWGGSFAGATLPQSRPDLCVAAAILLLGLARLRRGRGASPAAACLAAVALAYAAMAPRTEPRPDALAQPARLAGVLLDLEPRPDGYRLELQLGGRREPIRVAVPRTGEPRLDALPPGTEPGATVELPARPGTGPWARAPAAALVRVVRPVGALTPTGLAPRMRARFRARALRRLLPPGAETGPSGLNVALLTGMRSWIPRATASDLRLSGLAHLLVVSGLHVGWIVLGATGPLRAAAGRGALVVTIGAALAAIVAASLLPASPPVRRAVGAILVARVASAGGRRVSSEAALAGAVAVVLLVDPGLGTRWSFALTVAAAGALALAAGATFRVSRPALLAAPALATWPLLTLLTHRLHPWGIPFTVPGVPLTGAALALSWIAFLVPEGPAAEWAARAAHGCAALLEGLVRTAATMPGSGRITAPAGIVWAASLEFALLTALVARRGGRGGRVALLACLALWAWPLRPPSAEVRRAGPELWVFDVGQGQAALLRENGAAVLFDCADDRFRDGTTRLIGRLAALGVRRIDAIAVSHPDRDHAGGLAELLAALEPRTILVSDSSLDHPALAAPVARAAARGVPVRPMRAGERARVGSIELEAWSPPPGEQTASNASSLVVRASTSRFTVWIAGDAEADVESRLLAARRVPHTPLLVAGHHGSRDASSAGFLEALAPRVVIVSSGASNRFGHPHPELRRRVRRLGSRLLVTAEGGDVLARLHRGRLVVVQPALFESGRR